MPSSPVNHQLPELTHVHRVGDAIQPSHPLSSPSPLTLNFSQHQGLFQWVSSSHQVAKVLELQLQHQSFQWIFRTDFLQDGAKDNPQQDGRRGKITFRIKSHTHQRCSEGSIKPCVHHRPHQTCLWVSEHLLRRHGSAVACRRGRGSGCSSPGCGINPLGGGRH